jgi:hypothetical protein
MPSFNQTQADTILTYIRSGAYPQVAAEAAGVHRKTFLDWLGQGEKAKAREPYRSFARSVRQAAAMARVKAETDLREKDPRFWLKHGPGRETPEYPGWTGEVKPVDLQDPHALPAVDGPEWNALCSKMLAALEAFPEARLALAEVMKGMTTNQ